MRNRTGQPVRGTDFWDRQRELDELWHLVDQGRRHRRGGSPRQRLRDAERDLQDGKLTRAEYDDLVVDISTEL